MIKLLRRSKHLETCGNCGDRMPAPTSCCLCPECVEALHEYIDDLVSFHIADLYESTLTDFMSAN